MLKFSDFDIDIAKKILNKTLENGGDFAEIFIEDSFKNKLKWSKQCADEAYFSKQIGVGIRLIRNNCVSYSYSDGLNLENILNIAEKLSKISKTQHEANFCFSSQKMNNKIKSVNKNISITDVNFEQKMNIVKTCEDAALSFSKEITFCNIVFLDTDRKFKVFNSEGLFAEDEYTLVEFYADVVAQRGNTRFNSYRTMEGDLGFEAFDYNTVNNLGKEAARTAIEFLSAKNPPAGKMDIVIGNGKYRGGVLVHEAIGHALEIDFIEKKTSVYTDLVDKKVASDIVTVIDDATLRPRPGSYNYDDEGNPAKRKELIKNGILKGFITDIKGAKSTKMDITGNGRRESYQYPPLPRMSCTFIDKGNDDPEDIIKNVKKGIYIKALGGGQGDLTGSGFVFNVDEAYLIEKGKITYPIKGVTITGSGLEVLNNIFAVGNDLDFEGSGRCGKFQYVPVSCGQPTIGIHSMLVGGMDL